MNPYDHARSSAAIHGGSWRDYHAVHAWFDATKSVQCHFTHRALRHHAQGIAESVRVHGPVIVNQDDATVAVETIGRQHMIEDCGRIPDAAEWLVDLRTPEWMPETGAHDPHAMAAASARRHGGSKETYLPLHEWFLETSEWIEGPSHLLFRHHAFGIFEAEAMFGPVIGEGRHAIATRIVAERHVQSVVGRTPAASDWLRRIKGDRWMVRAASARNLGLNDAGPTD